MRPVRRAVLYVEDPDTGRLVPVKLVLSADGLALVPAQLVGDSVGLARESTLSAVKSKVDSIAVDSNGRVAVQNPPNLDVALSTRASESTLSNVYSAVSSLAEDPASGLPLAFKNYYLRAPNATVPSGEVWFIPSGHVAAFASLTVQGYLRVEGTVKVKDYIDSQGIIDLEGGVLDVGWP